MERILVLSAAIICFLACFTEIFEISSGSKLKLKPRSKLSVLRGSLGLIAAGLGFLAAAIS